MTLDLQAMRAAALDTKRIVGDGGWWACVDGAVYTKRDVVRITKKGDIARNGYNGRKVLITMGTSACRRDRATGAHIASACPENVIELIDRLERAEKSLDGLLAYLNKRRTS